MVKNFREDLAKAKTAEKIVFDYLTNFATGYVIEDVSDDRRYYYKGDIKAIAADGAEIFIDVKDDSRIHKYQNVLCEEEVYYKDADYYGKGNMQSNYDVLAVVSQEEQKIYFMDFNVLKSIYRKYGEYRVFPHYDQDTHCYLLDLCRVKQFGGMIATVNY